MKSSHQIVEVSASAAPKEVRTGYHAKLHTMDGLWRCTCSAKCSAKALTKVLAMQHVGAGHRRHCGRATQNSAQQPHQVVPSGVCLHHSVCNHYLLQRRDIYVLQRSASSPWESGLWEWMQQQAHARRCALMPTCCLRVPCSDVSKHPILAAVENQQVSTWAWHCGRTICQGRCISFDALSTHAQLGPPRT